MLIPLQEAEECALDGHNNNLQDNGKEIIFINWPGHTQRRCLPVSYLTNPSQPFQQWLMEQRTTERYSW